jgi:two-component system response regulator YesN
MKNILLVEDCESAQFVYGLIFKKFKLENICTIRQVFSGEEALDILPEMDPHLIIVDITLPGMDGISFCRSVKELYPYMKILIVTGHERSEFFKDAEAAEVDGFVTKGNNAELSGNILRLLGVHLQKQSTQDTVH